eukprot:TRINITY_DN973_c0_g1_i2.p1 TRINITY_DN973_c0_g1~~TRINITY_DN973_c0_g1_i2.p1  ORF type:complete len:394 (-),score=83.66 TRINITY_DN973_c0_g1_i2:1446-2591(-)
MEVATTIAKSLSQNEPLAGTTIIEYISPEENGYINFHFYKKKDNDEDDDDEKKTDFENNSNDPGAKMTVSSLPDDEAVNFSPSLYHQMKQFEVLGIVQSCFPEKFGTPRQASLAPSTRGRLILNPIFNSNCVEGLHEFSHIWLIFIFDKNSDSTNLLKGKIRAPKLAGEKTGVFATRSPHRLNPIGLSLAKLEAVQTNVEIGGKSGLVVLELSGIDLVHNTPVLDIKPYHPADRVPLEKLRFPGWIRSDNAIPVSFTEEAAKSLDSLVISGKLRFYNSTEDARQVIVECLQIDPRTTHSRNKSHKLYGIALDRMDVTFTFIPSPPPDNDDHKGAGLSGGEQIVVLKVKLCAQAGDRRRMRTKEWFEAEEASLVETGPRAHH